MTNIYLTNSEIVELTNRKRYKAQSKVLSEMEVAHLVHPDGPPKVLRSHAYERLRGGIKASDKSKPNEPEWGAM